MASPNQYKSYFNTDYVLHSRQTTNLFISQGKSHLTYGADCLTSSEQLELRNNHTVIVSIKNYKKQKIIKTKNYKNIIKNKKL